MSQGDSRQPGLKCWYCAGRLNATDAVRDGILRSREESQGGPYHLYSCPRCQRANQCEKTRKGRWFSSPNFRPNILDYLIGRFFSSEAEDFLQAVSWYRENEERRRYHFERDGDRRYSSGGFLWSLWIGSGEKPKAIPDPESQEEKARAEPPPRDRKPERPRPRIVTPWEILGIAEGAAERDIHRAFHRLAVRYHPDKVHHLGEEFQEAATEKFKQLQRAYNALLKAEKK